LAFDVFSPIAFRVYALNAASLILLMALLGSCEMVFAAWPLYPAFA
jgi:hypothetical protein